MLGWTFDTIIIKLMVHSPYTEHLNDRAGILALALSSRRILAGEGIIIVGGFFAKEAREPSYAKMSLGTFPKLGFRKEDMNRVVVKKFTKAVRAAQHAAIANCYREYNAKGGRVLTVQSEQQVYFPKAIVLAIYADFPATQKITLTGSACPMCFTAARNMGAGRSLLTYEVHYLCS